LSYIYTHSKLTANYKFSLLHNHISQRPYVLTLAVVLIGCAIGENCCPFIGWEITEWCSVYVTGQVISSIWQS